MSLTRAYRLTVIDIDNEERVFAFATDRRSDDVDQAAHQLAGRICYQLKARSTYGQPPSTIQGTVTKLVIEKDEEKWIPAGTITFSLPVGEMDLAVYRYHLERLLEAVPLEFQSMVETLAYEQAHSSGYIEVLGAARDLVNALAEPIAAYSARISAEQRALQSTKGHPLGAK